MPSVGMTMVTNNSSHMEIASKDAHKGLFKLLIGEGVAEGVHRTVGVAEKVGEHVHMAVDATSTMRQAVALDQRQNVIRCPAGDESAQDEGNGSQRFARPVLRFRFLSLLSAILLLFPAPFDPLADRAN